MKKNVLILIIVAIVIAAGWAFNWWQHNSFPPTPINQVNNWKTYTNNAYGFILNFPNTWKGYTVAESSWQGRDVNTNQEYSGPEIIIKNPQTTAKQAWQDIPIMVFNHDEWTAVSNERGCGQNEPGCKEIAVSAAPIPPAKIGENAKYVFATPPRWYGFTDAIGFQEAVNIVKTFKGF